MSSIDSLISEFEFVDVFATNKYKKLYQPAEFFTYSLDDIISLEDLRIIDYTIGNYIITVDWNPLNTRLNIIMSQNEIIIRTAEFYIRERAKFIIDPEITGSSLKIFIYIDLDDELRPMYIYKSYDLMQEVV